jgi:membrane protease YdiL (CAAX protease family)
LAEDAGWRWGALAPVLALIGLGLLLPAVVIIAHLPTQGDPVVGYDLAGELLLGAAVVSVASPIARRHGGWNRALGLGWPVRADRKRVFQWVCIQLGTRAAGGALLHLVAPHLPSASNLSVAGKLGPAGAVMLLTAAVIVAPLVEELAFRGLMLRAMMRRLAFWPAAGISSLIFAAFHAPEASTALGAAALVLFIFLFGLLQCVLVRRTARLAPAIAVHVVMNLLAATAALAAH